MTDIAAGIRRFLAELRRRRVLRVTVTYAIVVWLLLQVAEVTFEPLRLPDWALTLLVVLAIIGFPVVVALSWAFQVTPEGISRDHGAETPAGEDRDDAPGVPDEQTAQSVAVLAFDDMSPEKDQAYLCEGIAEEILNCLGRVQGLRVASRTSSFRFRGQAVDVATIGRELKVRHILEGSVRKADSRLRITAQLSDVASGYTAWSESYDRELQDIFRIQDEIAASVAEALQVRLGTHPPPAQRTAHVEAYDYYLKGLHYFHRYGPRNVRFAIEMFSRAVQADPSYARGWAALADSYAMISMYWDASEVNVEQARQASVRALELAPELAESHVSRGLAYTVERQPALAEQEFKEAIRLNPELYEAHYFYARVCFQQGKLEQAAELFEAAERLNPEDFQAPILLRQTYRSLGRLEGAKAAASRGVARAEKHLELNPDDTRALNLGLGGLVELGERDRALEFAERSLAIDGDNPDTLYNVACGLAMLDETDRALDCLERACLQGMQIAEWAENDADLESLHGHPRFRAILDGAREGRCPT